MVDNFVSIYYQIKSLLKSEIAAVKLLVIRYGLDINGADLANKIADYPNNFRTKRAKKEIAMENNQLFDKQTGNIPYIPEEIYLVIGDQTTVVKVNYRPDSNFKLLFEEGALQIVCKSLDKKWSAKLSLKQRISGMQIDGYAADNYIQVLGADRMAILGYDGCDEFYKSRQCLFCDSNPIRPNEKSARPSLNELYNKYNGDIKSWLRSADGYIQNCREVYQSLINHQTIKPHQHLHVMAGNLPDSDLEWEYMLKLSTALSNVKPLSEVDSYLNLLPPANPQYLIDSQKIGYKKLIFNIEVYGEEWFKTVCAGKHAVIHYSIFIERMKQAVNLFGRGNVYCGFVLGAQPICELKAGVEKFAAKGIVADYTVFTPKTGTAWENKEQPHIEEVADFSIFLAGIYKQYGYKSLYCNLSSRSSIMSEL